MTEAGIQNFTFKITVCFILGLVTRLCDGKPAMWQPPNVDNCSTVEITRIREDVNNLNAIFAVSRNPSNSDLTVIIDPDDLESITSELSNATDRIGAPILPNDLINIIDTVGVLLRLFYIL